MLWKLPLFSINFLEKMQKVQKENTNKVITKMQDLGFGVTLADIALPSTYFAQIPSNFALRPRS